MKSKELMTDKVISWRKSSRDSAGPGKFVDNSVARPYASILGSGYQSSVINLDYRSGKSAIYTQGF